MSGSKGRKGRESVLRAWCRHPTAVTILRNARSDSRFIENSGWQRKRRLKCREGELGLEVVAPRRC